MASMASEARCGLLSGLAQAEEATWLQGCLLTKARLDYDALRRSASSIVDGRLLGLQRQQIRLLEELQASLDQKKVLAQEMLDCWLDPEVLKDSDREEEARQALEVAEDLSSSWQEAMELFIDEFVDEIEPGTLLRLRPPLGDLVGPPPFGDGADAQPRTTGR